MTSSQRLHRRAMATVERADRVPEPYRTRLLRRAAVREILAARQLRNTRHRLVEPTRSILYRSAATLAWRVGKYRLAVRLCDEGLTGRGQVCTGQLRHLRQIASEKCSTWREPSEVVS